MIGNKAVRQRNPDIFLEERNYYDYDTMAALRSGACFMNTDDSFQSLLLTKRVVDPKHDRRHTVVDRACDENYFAWGSEDPDFLGILSSEYVVEEQWYTHKSFIDSDGVTRKIQHKTLLKKPEIVKLFLLTDGIVDSIYGERMTHPISNISIYR